VSSCVTLLIPHISAFVSLNERYTPPTAQNIWTKAVALWTNGCQQHLAFYSSNSSRLAWCYRWAQSRAALRHAICSSNLTIVERKLSHSASRHSALAMYLGLEIIVSGNEHVRLSSVVQLFVWLRTCQAECGKLIAARASHTCLPLLLIQRGHANSSSPPDNFLPL